MARIKVDEETKTILSDTVEKSAEYRYKRELLREFVAAVDDVDMRKYPNYDNPVQVLIEGAHASKAGIQPAEYDPEADLDGWLDSETVRDICSTSGAEINPVHVGSKSKPRDRADRRSLLAAMVRYRHEEVHISNIQALVKQEFGESDGMLEYIEGVCKHELWKDPTKGDGWFIADPGKAAASTHAMIMDFREDIEEVVNNWKTMHYGPPWDRDLLEEMAERVSKLTGYEGNIFELTLTEWNRLVEWMHEEFDIEGSGSKTEQILVKY